MKKSVSGKPCCMPKFSSSFDVSLLSKCLILHRSVISQLEALRQEGIDEYELEYEDCGSLEMLDTTLKKWRKGTDELEAEMEWMAGSDVGKEGRARGIEALGWSAVLPKIQHVTRAYERIYAVRAAKVYSEQACIRGGVS